MTSVLEKPELDDVDTDDPGKVAHYLRKKLHDAYVTGEEVEALCGYRWVPHRDPQNLPVCQKCKELYEAMKA